MAGIEAKDIQEIVDQIEGFRKMIEKAGEEGSNKLKGTELEEVLKAIPRKDDKFDKAGWDVLDADKQQQVYQRLVLVRDTLHAAAVQDGPTDPKHIMSAEYASNTSIVLLTFIGFVLTALLLIAIVSFWDQATGNAPAQKEKLKRNQRVKSLKEPGKNQSNRSAKGLS